MQDLQEIKIADYTYDLPGERIARFPLERREDARLLILEEDGEIREGTFRDAPSLARAGDTLVFNDTRVIHARARFRKTTGAVIEVFCLEPADPVEHALNLASTGTCEWYCLVGNARRWKGEPLVAEDRDGRLRATRAGSRGDETRVRFEWDGPRSFGEVLEALGEIPLPPYLGREAVKEDETRYQTVYACHEGSVAAPTAGLHFTGELLHRARAAGVETRELTLHVGAGTFKPVTAASAAGHVMHAETIVYPRSLVEHLAVTPGDVIAVGTTTTRSLESLYWTGVKLLHGLPAFHELGQREVYKLPGDASRREALEAVARWMAARGEENLRARSELMIVPGYRFRVVSGLFTNFHQPRSTLLLLVAAVAGDAWRRVYDEALARGFRFLSYGDGCFLRVAGGRGT
jgi:S-adenosylmethionine:tRNA ribosyltransferase-isomerase